MTQPLINADEPEDREGLMYFLSKTIIVKPKMKRKSNAIEFPKNKRKGRTA